MQLTLAFILGLCAITAHATRFETLHKEAELMAVFDRVYMPTARDGILDTIREYIESAIATIKEKVQEIVEKAKEIGASVKDKVLNIAKTAAEKIANFVADTETKITDLTNKGAAYKKCVQEYKPKLTELYAKSKEDIKTCTAEAYEYAEKVHGNAVDQLLAVTKHIAALRDAIKTCFQPSNPVASVMCAVSKAKEVKDSIGIIISNAIGAFNAATTIVSNSYSCVTESIEENKAKGEAIVEEIKACAAKNSFIY